MGSEKKKNKNHIVVFRDLSGNVLKTAFVSHGEKASPPKVPEKNGETAHHEYIFAGWDQDISHVTGNIVTVPVYEKTPKKYLIMYFSDQGKILGTETVPYKSPAAASFHPEKEGNREFYYEFTGWDQDLSHIEGDLMAKPVFEKKRHRYSVEFFHEDGSKISHQDVYYGQAAVEPDTPVKEPDPVWHYEFAGWDCDFSHITQALSVHAAFRPIYNEYTVSFYDEGELCREYRAHYGDQIDYPLLHKKGYSLVWEPEEKTVTGDIAIHGTYFFTNPKGKIVSAGQGDYEIMNPSVTEGEVKLLSWKSADRQQSLQVPDRVMIGDYSYKIREIGRAAFAGCRGLKRLKLPDSVVCLDEYALSDCPDLREIETGKGLERIGRKAFAHSGRLHRIHIPSGRVKMIDREAFTGIFREAVIAASKAAYRRLEGQIGRITCRVEII